RSVGRKRRSQCLPAEAEGLHANGDPAEERSPSHGRWNSTHAPGQNERQKQREYEDTQVKRSQRRLRSKCQTFSQQHLFTRIAQQNIERSTHPGELRRTIATHNRDSQFAI